MKRMPQFTFCFVCMLLTAALALVLMTSQGASVT